MKVLLRFIAVLALVTSTLQAKELGVDVTEYTTLAIVNTIPAGAKTVTIILSNVSSGAGAIQLESALGSGVYSTVATTDKAIYFEAPQGDKLTAINFKIVSGGIRVARLQ